MERPAFPLSPPDNLIITGIPRSGTTLLTALVDSCSDSVAFSEPQEHADWASGGLSGVKAVQRLQASFAERRRRLLYGLPVADRRKPSGEPLTDYYPRRGDAKPDRAERPFARSELSSSFLLACKHNALYTALLPEIAASDAFSILAIVRNPLSVLRSWRRLELPVSSGRLPAGEIYWTDLRQLTLSDHPLYRKQLGILELFFSRYQQLSERLDLLRYEDLCADPNLVVRSTKRPLNAPPEVRQATPPESHAESEQLELVRHHVPSCAAHYPELFED